MHIPASVVTELCDDATHSLERVTSDLEWLQHGTNGDAHHELELATQFVAHATDCLTAARHRTLGL